MGFSTNARRASQHKATQRAPRLHQTTAFVAAGLICLTSLAAPAFAADPTVTLPVRGGTANLTITKSATYGTTSGLGNGEELKPAPGKGISGVEFTICAVKGIQGGLQFEATADELLAGFSNDNASYFVDSPLWWNKARELLSFFTDKDAVTTWNQVQPVSIQNSPLGPTYNWPSGSDSHAPGANIYSNTVKTLCRAYTTDTNGRVSLTGLPLGLYFVAETNLPSNVMPGKPFFVTLPMANEAGDGWIYNVFAYPKSDQINATKEADVSATKAVGTPVKYTITANIPNSSTAPDAFQIVDPVPYTLTFDEENLSDIVQVEIKTTGTTPVPPLYYGAAKDYTVTFSDTDIPLAGGQTVPAPGKDLGLKNVMTVKLTADGLAKLASFNDGKSTLVVNFEALVSERLIPDQPEANLVTNIAFFYADSESIESNIPYTTRPNVIYFGGINLLKTEDINNTPTVLSDDVAIVGGLDSNGDPVATRATFRLYATSADARKGDNPIEAMTRDQADPDKWVRATEFSTDAAGSVKLLGLSIQPKPDCWFTSDGAYPETSLVFNESIRTSAATADSNAKRYGTLYWAVETQAPFGYILQASPQPVCVSGVLDNDAAANSYDDVHVVNVKADDLFKLPITGWSGIQGIIVLLGFVFFILAAGYAIKQYRDGEKLEKEYINKPTS